MKNLHLLILTCSLALIPATGHCALIEGFTLTIGDPAKAYDFYNASTGGPVNCLQTGCSVLTPDAVTSETFSALQGGSVAEGTMYDTLEVVFTDFDPGESFGLVDIDIDIDGGSSLEFIEKVLFDNGVNTPNAVWTVTFSNATVLSMTLPETPTPTARGDYYFTLSDGTVSATLFLDTQGSANLPDIAVYNNTVVPVPSAVFLFVSGIAGLIGFTGISSTKS